MALYAIGDVQGCFDELRRLLETLHFDPAADRLLFTGDLVNRGPQSLQTLRFIRDLGSAAATVLGNHDLHLLAVAQGISKTKHRDTFGDVLGAPDCGELLDWLRRQPLLHHEGEFYLIHAGLPPQWTPEQAMSRAFEVGTVLARDNYPEFLRHMYGDAPNQWSDELEGWDRLRFTVNCLTRMRFCDLEGRLDFREKGRPGSQPPQLLPWFEAPARRSADVKIVFGHWSTLGFYAGNGVFCLDTGCLWGGALTALRLDRGFERFGVACGERGYQIASGAGA